MEWNLMWSLDPYIFRHFHTFSISFGLCIRISSINRIFQDDLATFVCIFQPSGRMPRPNATLTRRSFESEPQDIKTKSGGKKLKINFEVSEIWWKLTPDSSKPTIGECRWYMWCFRKLRRGNYTEDLQNLRQTWGDQPPILNWCWPNFWSINSSLERQVGLSFITQVEECRLQKRAYIYVHSLYIIERLLSVRLRVISPSSLEDDFSIVARW